MAKKTTIPFADLEVTLKSIRESSKGQKLCGCFAMERFRLVVMFANGKCTIKATPKRLLDTEALLAPFVDFQIIKKLYTTEPLNRRDNGGITYAMPEDDAFPAKLAQKIFSEIGRIGKRDKILWITLN